MSHRGRLRGSKTAGSADVSVGFAPDLLAGRRALVTGAAGGIGRALVTALRACGASVVALDREPAAARPGVVPAVLDLNDGPAIRDLAERLAADGSAPVSILVNNAGVFHRRPFGGAGAPPLDASWDATLAVNATAPFRLVEAFLPALASGGGAVVNVASVRGYTACERAIAYTVSKGAIIALTRSLAVELGPRGIRVNAVAPGDVRTPMTQGPGAEAAVQAALRVRAPLGREAEPEEVASAAVFLASPLASFITGAVLPVDGGFLAT